MEALINIEETKLKLKKSKPRKQWLNLLWKEQ
jgi:hypothetical protein